MRRKHACDHVADGRGLSGARCARRGWITFLIWQVRAEVAALLDGKLCVGHDLAHDLAALDLEIDPAAVRDTARGLPRRLGTRSGRPKRLRDLAAHHLRLTIQACAHSLYFMSYLYMRHTLHL